MKDEGENDQPTIMKVLNFTQMAIFLMFLFFAIVPFLNYSIHYVIMAILSFCFYLSFRYFLNQLKKNPELLNQNEKEKEKNE